MENVDEHQWLPKRGRTLSPPIRRVIVYNREDKSMQVHPKNSLGGQLCAAQMNLLLTLASSRFKSMPKDTSAASTEYCHNLR